MISPPFSAAVKYDMGQELENGFAGRRTRVDSRVSAPPPNQITRPMAIAVGRVLFLPNHLKQGRLAVLKTDGTSGRRIHGWLKLLSNPP